MNIPIQFFSISDIKSGGLPTSSANTATVQNALQIVFGIIGALAFLMIVISGFRYVLSAGNPDRASRAKNGIIYALIGLVIALAAETIVTYVVTNI